MSQILDIDIFRNGIIKISTLVDLFHLVRIAEHSKFRVGIRAHQNLFHVMLREHKNLVDENEFSYEFFRFEFLETASTVSINRLSIDQLCIIPILTDDVRIVFFHHFFKQKRFSGTRSSAI